MGTGSQRLLVSCRHPAKGNSLRVGLKPVASIEQTVLFLLDFGVGAQVSRIAMFWKAFPNMTCMTFSSRKAFYTPQLRRDSSAKSAWVIKAPGSVETINVQGIILVHAVVGFHRPILSPERLPMNSLKVDIQ